MKDLIKHVAIISTIFATATCCVASKPPALDNAQVLQLATTYAQKEKWDVITLFRDARFNETTREWQVSIQTKQNGGPMIVYVNDDTRKVRHTRGE